MVSVRFCKILLSLKVITAILLCINILFSLFSSSRLFFISLVEKYVMHRALNVSHWDSVVFNYSIIFIIIFGVLLLYLYSINIINSKIKNIIQKKVLVFLLIILSGLAITQIFLTSGDLRDMLVREQYVIRYTQDELYSNLKDFSIEGSVIISTSNDPWIFLDTTSVKPFKYIRLDIDLLGAERVWAQFFYWSVSEEWFSEANSKRQILRNGVNHIRIPIREYRGIRLDLTEIEGVALSVRSVELTNKFRPSPRDMLLGVLLNALWWGIFILVFKIAYLKKHLMEFISIIKLGMNKAAEKLSTMYPSEYLEKLWKSITFPVKITFVSTIIIGLIAYLFHITNMLPNHDSVFVYHDSRWIVTQGRWFFSIADRLNSYYILPWVSGFMTIIYIAISACLVIKCLRINNNLNCVLISGLMVSFPSVTIALLYFADTFYFSLLLACLAVYITARFRFGFCIGFVFIAMSLGIYQAFISVAAGLAVGILIVDILQTNIPVKKILLKGMRLFLMLLLGLIAYFIMVKMSLKYYQAGLTTYMGIDEMGRIPIAMLPLFIKQAYAGIYHFFVNDIYNAHSFFLPNILSVLFFISCIIFVIIVKEKQLIKKRAHFFLLIFLSILFPIASNVIYLMNASFIYLNMIYGVVLVPIAVIVLLETVQKNMCINGSQFTQFFKRIACWMISISFLLCIYNYVIFANIIYKKAHIVYEQGYAYSVELATRIQSTDGYTMDIPVLLYGDRGASINEHPAFNKFKWLTGSTPNLPASYSYVPFMQNYLGFRDGLKIFEPVHFELYNIEKQELYIMPRYPEPGSIKRINDVLVVKF